MSPLSELVWSPNEGLSLRVAQSSPVKKKASLRWNTEIFNIVLSSPQQSGEGMISDNEDNSIGDTKKTTLQRRSCSEGSKRAAMPCFHRSTDMQRSSRFQDSSSSGEINLRNKMEEMFNNNYQEIRQLEQEVGNCSKRCSKAATQHRTSCSGPAKNSSSPISMWCFKKEPKYGGVDKEVRCIYAAKSLGKNQKDSVRMTNLWSSKSVEENGCGNYVLQRNSMGRISPTNSRPLDCTERIVRDTAGFSGGAHYRGMGNKSKEFDIVVASKYHCECEDENMQENCRPKPSFTGSRLACNLYTAKQEKGKEKVLYSDDDCASAAKESDDSNESIESRPSTKLISKRRRTWCSNCMMSLGSKRARKDDYGSACSGSLRRNGSSFLNWISKITNGLDMFDKAALHGQQLSVVAKKDRGSPTSSNEDDKMVPLRTVGFGSLFQSLYCHNMMINSKNSRLQSGSSNTGHVANQLNLDSKPSSSLLSGANLVKTERLQWGNLHFICGSEAETPQNQLGVLPLRAVNISSSNNNLLTQEEHGSTLACIPGNPRLSDSSNKSSSGNLEGKGADIHGCSSNMVDGRGEFLESFWITRLLPKVPTTLQEPEPCNMDTQFPSQKLDGVANTVNKDCDNEADYKTEMTDEKLTPKISLIMPLQEVKKSEAMSSIFARRSRVLRYVKHSVGQCSATCQPGPSEVKNNSFIVSCESRDKLDTSPKSNRPHTKDGRMVLWSEHKHEDPHDVGGNRNLQEVILDSENILQTVRSSKVLASHVNYQDLNPVGEYCGQNEMQVEEVCSGSMEYNQIMPYCSSIPNHIPGESLAILEAVRRLRLSRTDIIRWLKSSTTCATLDGFFLRIRLGKWEEALGGTGYYVARIIGAIDDNSLSVSIRNSKCLVDSRFVSNNDFLEDELKAWWSCVLKGYCKLPSKEELSSKLREKELFR